MNTKIYKTVCTLSSLLLKATEKGDDESFTAVYEELKNLCYDYENNVDKNHPVQWETLADFTEDPAEALIFHKKAITCAVALNINELVGPINYAMAILFNRMKEQDNALKHAFYANEYALKESDDTLKNKVDALLETLQANSDSV